MQILKSAALLTGMVLTGFTLFAQEYKTTVENSGSTKIILKDFTGELPIEGYDGTDIVLSTTDEDLVKVPEKAKGLKPIYSGGTDNTGIGVAVEKNGSQVTITCLLGFGHDGQYRLRVPNHVALDISSDCAHQNALRISNMTSEVVISTCANVDLSNVTGPLVVSTISGDIKVVFSQVSKDKPISLASVSGDVDVTIPASTPANVELSNISGGIYTDFDLDQAVKNGMRQVGGGQHGILSTVNGGGVAIKITNISGNIYLRKG